MLSVGLTSDPVLELAFHSSISTDLGATSDSGMIYPNTTCNSLAAALEWHRSLKEGGHFIPIKCSLTCGLQACTSCCSFFLPSTSPAFQEALQEGPVELSSHSQDFARCISLSKSPPGAELRGPLDLAGFGIFLVISWGGKHTKPCKTHLLLF